METLTILSISRPPASIVPIRQASTSSENLPNSVKSRVSVAKSPHPRFTDSHLDYFCKNGSLTEAVIALDSLAQNGSKVRPKTFMNLLQCCIDSNSVSLGRRVHAQISLVEERTPFLETMLLGMYAKCGCLADARKVFDEMPERNLYSWSAMIGACSRDHRWAEVVELFYMMMQDAVVPDGFLFPKILQACGNCGDVDTAASIHSLVVKCGMGSLPRVNNSILAVYAKCGKLSLARRFFEGMDKRDRVAWNAMITGYCQKGKIKEANRLFDAMYKEGIEPCLITWNILITCYNQLGYCDVALELMNRMESSGINPDVVAWTSMISGFAQNRKRNEALDLFKEMILAGVKPNGVTIACAISACASLKVLTKGLETHSFAVKMGFVDDVLVGNSLIDMYSKCGEMEAAQEVFNMMLEKDMYTWNSMIGGYCQAGCCGKAYLLFMEMQKSDVQPNVITWNTMISGYIQNGDEYKAMDLFQRMQKDGKIKRDAASWNSLIAGYFQIGQKDKALDIFRQMQSSGFTPNPITILSVLPACANLVASKKVKEIHGCLLRRNLDSMLSIANSLIDTYAKSGNIGYSRSIFDRMSSKDLITMNSLINGYVLHGCSDAAIDLVDQMRKLEHVPNRNTFANIILAHSRVGMVDKGKLVFSSMKEDYQVMPSLEHYSAMIDLYGRTGRLTEAVEFIKNMPIKPDFGVWSSFLTACRIHGDLSLAVHAWESLPDSDQAKFLIQQTILKAYKTHGKDEDVPNVKRLEGDNEVRKLIGQSWIEVKNTVHSFVAGDQSKSYSDVLFSWVHSISREAEAHDLHGRFWMEEEEDEEIVGVHSEKLALAFAFVHSPSAPQSIRIVKNLRMCKSCHEITKYISMKYGCEIYLSDSKSFHHFKSGHCSCGDYW